jgi:hypothetical protein
MNQLSFPFTRPIVTDPKKIQGYLNAMLAILKYGRRT